LVWFYALRLVGLDLSFTPGVATGGFFCISNNNLGTIWIILLDYHCSYRTYGTYTKFILQLKTEQASLLISSFAILIKIVLNSI